MPNPGEPETALDKAWSDLLDEMWAKATGPDFEEMLERHRPAIEAEAREDGAKEQARKCAAHNRAIRAESSVEMERALDELSKQAAVLRADTIESQHQAIGIDIAVHRVRTALGDTDG